MTPTGHGRAGTHRRARLTVFRQRENPGVASRAVRARQGVAVIEAVGGAASAAATALAGTSFGIWFTRRHQRADAATPERAQRLVQMQQLVVAVGGCRPRAPSAKSMAEPYDAAARDRDGRDRVLARLVCARVRPLRRVDQMLEPPCRQGDPVSPPTGIDPDAPPRTAGPAHTTTPIPRGTTSLS